MVLCVCTGITDGKLRWAVERGGATTAAEAFDVLGLHPDCRRCQASLEAAVQRVRAGEACAPQEAGEASWRCRGRCAPAWGTPRTLFAN